MEPCGEWRPRPVRDQFTSGTLTMSIAAISSSRRDILLQRELHGDGHDDRHGGSVQQRRRELPLADGVNCRLVEERDRTQYPRIRHMADLVDRHLHDDHALNVRRLGFRRVHRIDVLRFHRWLDVAADAQWLAYPRGSRGILLL